MVKGGLFHVVVKTQSIWLCPLSLSFCNFLRDTSSLSLSLSHHEAVKAIKVNNIWTEPQQVVNEWGYHSTTINFPLSGRRCQILKKVSFSLESWESHTIRISTKNGGLITVTLTEALRSRAQEPIGRAFETMEISRLPPPALPHGSRSR